MSKRKKVEEKKSRSPLAFSTEPIIKGMQKANKVCEIYKIDFDTLSNFLRGKGIKIANENSVLNLLALTLVAKQFGIEEPTQTVVLQGRPRVMAICRAYNISIDTLLAFLKTKGIDNVNLHSIVDTSILELIDNEFKNDKSAKDKIRGKTEIHFDSNQATSSSDVTYREAVIHIDENRFNSFRKHVSYHDLPIIESFFSDLEARILCSKMSSSYTRGICKKLATTKAEFDKLNYVIEAYIDRSFLMHAGKQNVSKYIIDLETDKKESESLALLTKLMATILVKFPDWYNEIAKQGMPKDFLSMWQDKIRTYIPLVKYTRFQKFISILITFLQKISHVKTET